MNIQEREQLANFLSQLVGARLTEKDADAEALIRDAVAKQPDATYLLVQKSFLQELALKNAQGRIDQLQAEVNNLRAATQSRGSFADANAWGNQPVRSAPMASSPATQAFAQPTSSWGSGLLGNIATTAAGVVAGSFLFQGIEHLIGHHESGGLFGGNSLAAVPNETIVNNFFSTDEARSASDGGFAGLSDGLDATSDTTDDSWM